MPALSKKQQRFMGMVYATKKGEMDDPSPEVQKAADSMKKSDAKDFASTKHKGLPEKKVAKEGIMDTVKRYRNKKNKPSKSTHLKDRDAGAIAAKRMRQKDHDKYVNFLPVGEKYDAGDFEKLKKKIGDKEKHDKPSIEEEDNYSQATSEIKKTKAARDQRFKSLHKKTDDSGNVDVNEDSNPRIPRKKGQPANSKKHSDLYTDENPKGTIHGLGFKDVATAKASVSKIRNSSRSHAHKIQAAVAMEQRAREMGKTSEAAVYRKFINSMKKKTKKMNEGSLHKWFKGSKSKDGKGGWVNVVTGGTCASDEPGEGTPKCVSSSKRASMSKSERLSAARRKKKADPGQQSKAGAAKPTYVSTDTPRKKKMKEENLALEMHDTPKNVKKIAKELDKAVEMHKSQAKRLRKAGISEAERKLADRLARKRKVYDKTTKKAMQGEASGHARYRMSSISREMDGIKAKMNKEEVVAETKKKDDTYLETDFKKRLKNNEKARKELMKGPQMKNPHLESYDSQEEVSEAKDKKGKGSGSKDACYHKVKSRYSVWPSAYASGALVKCRKVGAANWGNSSKKEEFSPLKEGISFGQFQEKCWPGYEKKGMKTMFGKRYPNCVKKTKSEEVEPVDEGAAWTKKSGKNPSGGLNEKGRKSYERDNPGSDLKAPSKKVGNKRRASFCARMKGMKKKLTSSKTANDPDSRINKSLRAWNC